LEIEIKAIKKYNMYNKMLRNYYKPTPVKWRKLGDALLAVSVTITGFAMYENVQWVALTALITGVIGKFLTNFFKDDDIKTRKQGRSRKNPSRVS
jgi:hypothetical protein